MRLENLKECYELAFDEFLGIRGLKLIQENVGHEKNYGEFYREFVEKVRFPSSYVDGMYNSKYMRHFYTNDEIAAYRLKWEGELQNNNTIIT